jgi:hydrophobe/amphiphile efflux-1 (HAE1) family protein
MDLKALLRRPILATVISLIITLCGAVALFNLPVSQFPDISPPSIQINASYPGANAETAARVVAAQIENQLNGISGLTYMATSTSSIGNVNITLTYDVGTDLNYAINEVLNRLYAAMPLLPSVVQRMGVTARKSSPDMLLLAAFYADPYLDPKFVSNYLQRTVQNDLLLLPSVGTINVFGSGSYAIRIWLDPNKMQRYGITVNDLQNVIKDQNVETFVGRSNGSPGSKGDNLVLNLKGNEMYSTPEQFANMVILNNNAQRVLVKDIARVELGSISYTTVAEVNFRDKKDKFKHYPCNVMQIFLQPGANQLAAKKQIIERLNQDAVSFPKGLSYRVTIDNSKFVAASVTNVQDTLLIAFALVGVIIFLFLQNWRASVIAICSIPVSIIGTMACLYVFNFSLNTLSLFAMVLAIGIVVDDAIVIVENIERLRNENPNLPLIKVVAMTLEEVFGAVLAIVLVLSVVFIPAMGLKGLSGNMYRQFAVTIACAVVLSGICALTFTPAISTLILKNIVHKVKHNNWFDRGFEKVTDFYVRIATFFVRHTKLAFGVWILLFAMTIGLFKLVPTAFVPNEDQGLIFATINLPSSSSLNDTNTKVHGIIEKLTKNPAIDSVISVAGFDFLDSGNQKTYAASFFISLVDWDKRHGKGGDADSIIKTLNILGMNNPSMSVRAFNQPTIRGLSTTGGIDFYLEDRVNGDTHKLQDTGQALIEKLKKHKEVGMAFQTLDTNVMEISIVPNFAMATFYGVDINNLYTAIQTIYSNNNVNYAYIMQGLVWVIMQADYQFRTTVDNLRNVYVKGTSTAASNHFGNSSMIPVASVVKVNNTRDAQVIQRFNGYMATKITAMPSPGYSFGDVMKVIVAEVGSVPKAYNYDWFGTSYQLTLSQKTSVFAFVFSIIMIYLVLSALYEMWRLALVVMMGIPFALFGAALILFFTGKQNDLYFQISLLALLGLSAKNIILLVEFSLQSFRAGNSVEESAIHALKQRFRPIVMTSMCFIFGTLPLAFATGAGANAQHSVGIGIIGGILGSVLLSSLLTPAFFVMIMRNYKHKVEQK